MKRDRYETVTEFALLIQASDSEAMGEAVFSSEVFGPPSVRAVGLEDIKAAAKKLKGTDAARFDALLSLRGALESNDQLALDRARERMERAFRLRQAEAPREPASRVGLSLGEFFAPALGLSPKETEKYIAGLRSGPKAVNDLRRLFSHDVSNFVNSWPQVQIVLWWFEGAFRPAIYCPEAKAALYIHTFFLAPIGGVGFRICPYDGEQFFQDRPNQEYCCPAHREAHRVARFRDNQKRRAAEREKNRRKHGTQKAR